MKHNAYVIFDSKAGIYNKPFYFINDNVALRAAEQTLLDPNTDMHKNPEDFKMLKIGTYCDETAQFTNEENVNIICRFFDLKNDLIRQGKINNRNSETVQEQEEKTV